MIRICDKGHSTGFRTCPQCGSRNVYPVAPVRQRRGPGKLSREERKIMGIARRHQLYQLRHFDGYYCNYDASIRLKDSVVDKVWQRGLLD